MFDVKEGEALLQIAELSSLALFLQRQQEQWKTSWLFTVFYKAGDQTWFIGEGAVAQKAVEEAGGEFIYVDAKMNPEEYLKAIDNAVANHASGIVTCIPDQTLSQAAIDKANEAGIPNVAADDALQYAGKSKRSVGESFFA